MKKLVAVFLGLAVAGCGAKEKEYNGKPVSFWVRCIDVTADASTRNQATQLLVDVGPRDKTVIAALIQSLKKGNYNAAEVLGRIGPVGDQTKDVVAALAESTNSKNNLSVRLAGARALP